MMMRRPLIAAAAFAISVCVLAGSALAFSGEGCSPTPTPGFTPKAIASFIKSWTAIPGGGGDKFEGRACAYYAMGILNAFIGDDRNAIDAYTRAITIMRDFPDAYEMRGDAYAELGMHAQADADYARANQSALGRANALNSRCWARAIRGVPLDRALTDCNNAIELSHTEMIGWGRTWNMYDSRCLVYLRMGNDAAAISDCSTALQGNAKSASSIYVRGLAKIQAGDRAGGNADIAAAKDLDYQIAEKYAVFGVKLALKN